MKMQTYDMIRYDRRV